MRIPQLTWPALAPVVSDAVFDPSGHYRYWLRRIWDSHRPVLNFIMLNPSTADETQDDPTVARCRRYAERWGFGTLIVTNIFAYRSTDPRGLMQVPDPIGSDNDQYLLQGAAQADRRIVAWGTHGQYHNREMSVLTLLTAYPVMALGITQGGSPRHPLYLRADAQPQAFTISLNIAPPDTQGGSGS